MGRAEARPSERGVFTHCGAIAVWRARKTYFWILPVAVLGSSLMKVTLCGALKCAMFARANSRSSLSVARAPCLRTTKACGASPQRKAARRCHFQPRAPGLPYVDHVQ